MEHRNQGQRRSYEDTQECRGAILESDLRVFIRDQSSDLRKRRAELRVSRALGKLYGSTLHSIYSSIYRYRQPEGENNNTPITKVKHLYLVPEKVLSKYSRPTITEEINLMLKRKGLPRLGTH